MDNQNKIIIVLLVIVAILGGIFLIKINTKDNEKTSEIIEEEYNVSEAQTQTTTNGNVIWEYNNTEVTQGLTMMGKLIKGINTYFTIIMICVWAFTTFCSIGLYKLYVKMQISYAMPWLVLTVLLSLINIISAPWVTAIKIVVGIIESIVSVLVGTQYLRLLEMPIWPLIVGAILLFIPVVNIISAIGVIVYAVIANIKLGKYFDEDKGFIVGLVLLPIIYMPILGYKLEKEN